MRIPKRFSDYIKAFNLNEGEKRAYLLVALLLVGLIGFQLLFKIFYGDNEEVKISYVFTGTLDSLNDAHKSESMNVLWEKNRGLTPFPFNPNTIDSLQIIKLGLPKWVAKNMLKYRRRGGIIRTSEAFAKIYGMKPEWAAELTPFLILPDKKKYIAGSYVSKPQVSTPITLIDLNVADSFSLLKVKGIGAYTAGQIVRYRKSLGGFYSKEQLLEINKMDTLRFKQIQGQVVLNTDLVKKININKVDIYTLSLHPYLSKIQATLIINYRLQHGNFKNLEDVIYAVNKPLDKKACMKMEPYLSY